MAIEFQCSKCGAALRAPDGTEGKKAKCKSCGEVVLIAPSGGAVPPTAPQVPPAQPSFPSPFPPPPVPPLRPHDNPFGTSGEPVSDFPQFGSPPGALPHDPNPFAAPRGMAAPPGFDYDADLRDGPPWERDGMSVGSFVATIAAAYSWDDFLFRRMHRSRGVGPPILFVLCGMTVSVIVAMAFQMLLRVAVPQPNQAPGEQVAFMVGMAIGLICILPVAYVVVLAIVGLNAAIYQGMLRLFGAARYPLLATFRTSCYLTAATLPWSLIPVVGNWIAIVVGTIAMILAIKFVQECSWPVAIFCVLIPTTIFCLIGVAIGLALFSMVVGMANLGP